MKSAGPLAHSVCDEAGIEDGDEKQRDRPKEQIVSPVLLVSHGLHADEEDTSRGHYRPKQLAREEQSVYRRMLDAEAEVNALWSSSTWRAVNLQGGTIAES